MISRKNYQFTSESVGEGHPDKVCDLISDAVLDKALEQDPDSRVACECFASTGMILVGGEITTSGYIDFIQVAREHTQGHWLQRSQLWNRLPLLLRPLGYQTPVNRYKPGCYSR